MHGAQTLGAGFAGTVALPEAGVPAWVKTLGVLERHNRIDSNRVAIFLGIKSSALSLTALGGQNGERARTPGLHKQLIPFTRFYFP